MHNFLAIRSTEAGTSYRPGMSAIQAGVLDMSLASMGVAARAHATPVEPISVGVKAVLYVRFSNRDRIALANKLCFFPSGDLHFE